MLLRYDAGRLPCTQRVDGDNTLLVEGHAFGPHSDGKCGVAFRALFRVLPEGGDVRADKDTVMVRNADAAAVVVALNTDFRGREAAALCASQTAAAQEQGWERLRAEHGADHQRLFRRVSLDLGGEQAVGQPTDVRLESVRRGQADPQLAALFFQYGQLQEWEQDDGGQTNHRHTSHLVGLFPLAQIAPRTTPDLAQAASRSLELRLGRKDWEDVEWSRANAMVYYARLLNGEKAEASMTEMTGKLVVASTTNGRAKSPTKRWRG